MIEISRDGKRLYVTNSLYRTWDDQFYPDGIKGWLAKIDVRANGGIELDPTGFLEFDGMRPHQVHWRRRCQLRFVLLFMRGAGHAERDDDIMGDADGTRCVSRHQSWNGWLFAVALGMQERRRGAVLRALVPLGAGHALAVAGAVAGALPSEL